MNEIAVSIVIPVYNVEKYLNRCIDSILMQTFTNFEVILVDDGSSDNSGRICDEYAKKDSRIKVMHKQNGGASSARNAGIKVAQGKLINFVDSDDTIPVDSLENLIKLQKENDADMVCCGYELQHLNNKKEKFVFIDKFINFSAMDNINCNVFLSNFFRGPCFKLYKNNILKENNFVFDETVSYGEDTIFVYEYLSKCENVQCGSEIVYKYWKNEQSITSRGHENIREYLDKFTRAQIEFFNKLNISDIQLKCCNTSEILVSLTMLTDHLTAFFSTEKVRKDTSEFFETYAEYFKYQDKDVEKFLENLGRKKSLERYRLLSSKNGLEKFLIYRIRQGNFNKFKAKLKKIKVIKKLNDLIKC